jgi:hypothetical protein
MTHGSTHLTSNTRGHSQTRRFLAGVFVIVGLAQAEARAQDIHMADAMPQTHASMPIHDAVARLTASPITAVQQARHPARNPVLLGTLIGAAGGAVWQASACGGISCNVGTAGLVGAGVGAYGGLVASAIQKARAKQPVSRGMKIGIAAGAIGAVGGAWLACYAAGGCGGAS